MADDRERNEGLKQGAGESGGQHAPGRDPQGDRSDGEQDLQRGENVGRDQDDSDPSRGGDAGSHKEDGQNGQTRR